MEAVAKTKYLKGSPRKTRLVIDLIRGENVARALSILKFTNKRAADPIAQCLNSAIANATYKAEQENIAIDPDDLWINACYVDMGPTKNRRRMRPAPQGRAYREQRHYCHITIQVTSDEQPKTDKQIRAEAAQAKRAAAGGVSKKKKDAPKPKLEVKAAEPKNDEVISEPVADPTVPTPVEPTAQDIVAASDAAAEPVMEVPVAEASDDAAAAEQSAEGDAEASDAKDVETQTPEALNETKPADDKQEDINEELERQ
jgi:large subunit ribosomal protein L22